MKLTRRGAIASALGVSAAVTLSACAADMTPLGQDEPTPTSEPQPTGPFEVCKTTDIPVGSGRRFEVEKVAILITQPKAGDFRAFSAICTHAGYVMSTVENSEIRCDNHGALYNADDGSVIKGPATRALGKIALTVEGDTILVSF